jgi:hypothetical protein
MIPIDSMTYIYTYLYIYIPIDSMTSTSANPEAVAISNLLDLINSFISPFVSDDDDDVYFIESQHVGYKNLYPYGPAKTV